MEKAKKWWKSVRKKHKKDFILIKDNEKTEKIYQTKQKRKNDEKKGKKRSIKKKIKK